MGTHQAGRTVMCLLEQVTCTVSDLLDITRHSDEHIARGAAHLLTATKSCAGPLVVEYVASAEDGCGCLYARQFAGQRVPRLLRLAANGRGHQEVDMVGAHYEIIRRSISGCTCPAISRLRAFLREEWLRATGLECEEAVKRWPLYVINGGVQTAIDLLRSHQLVATPAISSVAYELEAAQAAFTQTVLP